MRKLWPAFFAIVASVAFSLSMFNRLPERVVSHWGANGTPNGWMSRGAFVFGIHGLMIAVAVVLAFAPRIAPKRNNFEAHKGSYWLVANAAIILVAGITVISFGVNLGWNFRIESLGYGVGLLIIIMGNVTTRVRPNWIFGLRTPWTLSSDKSWRKANRFAGYGFVLVGLAVVVVTAIRPAAMVWVVLIGSIAMSLAASLLSYIVWKNDPLARHD
ncbi:MAG: SdpI family protein [Gemmatimonadaceae bacterium]